MGIINHNAVIATVGLDDDADKLRDWIDDLPSPERRLFSEQEGWAEGYRTFFLAPDGGKEGRKASDDGDDLRKRFVAQLNDHFQWIEVSYGEFGQSVVRGNNRNCY